MLKYINNSSQLLSLQVTRAIAAMFVVYFHIDNQINFGGFGVDLFFVLSGFVIAMTVSKNKNSLHFFINRISRLVPLYWVLTIAIFCLAAAKPTLLNSTTADLNNLIKSLLFIPYFKENGVLHPMLAVGWSLNYEMLFYFLVATSLMLTPKYAIELTTGLIFGLYIFGQSIAPSPELKVFLSPNFILDFCLGVLAFKTTEIKNTSIKLSSNGSFFTVSRFLMVSSLGIGIVFLYLFMIYSEISGYTNRLLVYGIPSFLIILLCLQTEPYLKNHKNIVLRAAVNLGDASYAIYLSHLFAIEFLQKVVVKYMPYLELHSILGNLVAFGLVTLSGCLIYEAVDRPLSTNCKKLLNSVVDIMKTPVRI